MDEMDRLLDRAEDWTEELLLRGTTQFAPEDTKLLERLAEEARRLGMELLEQLLLEVARAGEKVRLTVPIPEGDHAETKELELPGLFFRLCAYVQLARESVETPFDEESELETGEESGSAT